VIVFYVGIAIYLLGSAADVYTTKRNVIDRAGQYIEAKPIMARIMGLFGGRTGLVVSKLVVGVGFAAVAYFTKTWLQAGCGLAALGVIFGLAAWHNKRIVKK